MENFEFSNPYSVLAVSQDKDLHGGMIPIEVAEMEVDLSTIKYSTNNCLNPGVSDGHANSFVKNGGYVNPATAKSENWAEQVEAAEKDNNTEPFESVHRKKRKRFDSKSQRAQIVRPDASSPKPSGQLRRTTKESVTHVRNTRQQQALNKARSEATSFDQCCYVEWCADFHHVHYMKALEELLGKDSVYQLMKKSGHAMVALASIEKAERLVENGLTINNTFLRAFPYRRKAEKIILGNLPIAVREEDIIEALRPYCRVVFLAYEVVSCNGYTWTTGNREAFVLLNEGRKLHQLPAKLVIISKGESTPAYVTYGVRCSRCHRQGHRRATCPQGTRSGPVLTPPPSLPTPSHSFTATTSAEGNSGTIQTIHVTPPNPAASSPAESCPVLSQNTTATKPSTPAPSTSVLPSLLAPSSTTTSPTADPAKDQAKTALTMGSSVPKPQTTQLPQLTLQKVEDLFKVLDADSFLEPLYMDYHRWEIEKAVVCPTMREDVFTYLSPEQISALKKFLSKAIAHVGDKDSDLGKRLSDLRTECDIERDEPPWSINLLIVIVSLSAVRPRGARAPRFLEIEMEAMEISNVFSILAESQDDDKIDGGTPTQKGPTNAEKSAEEVFKPDSKNAFSIKQTTGDYVNQAAGKKQADANWAERVEASEKQSALESDWKIPKSNKRKGRESPTQQAKVAKAEATVARPSLQPRREVRDAVTHIRASRQQQDLAKARSTAATFDHCCFIEWSPDFHQVQYMKALEQMLGKSSVHQLMKMSGHVLVTLPSAEKAERLIEEGLTIGSTLLRAFPYRKRAEKIIIGNLPIAVKDDDIVATLRPYCKVASMAYEIVTCEGYSWTTVSREAFIFMNEGLKIHQLPVKLEIKSRGETTPAYISYGVKCSKCHRQGHRRASCPKRDLEERSTRQPTSQHGSLPPSTQTSPSSQPAATTPAAIGHNGPEKAPAKNVHTPMNPPPANKTSGTKALPAAAEVATSSKERPPNIAAPILTIAPGSRIPLKTNPLSKEDESSTDKRSKALRQLEEVLKQLPDTVFENTEAAGMEKEKIVQAIISERNMKKFLPDQKPEQLDSLINLIGTFVDRVEDKACHLYKRLTHLRFFRQHAVDVAFVQETNVLALNNIRDLCLGYSAVFAPSSTPRGSALAVVAAPGVTVLWHRVLWPGKIAIASVKIRGLETRVINCHLSHTPEERHLQLQIIAEEAIREDAWALGDINISEESSSDIGSGAVEAFAELLDRTALVDIAAIFDAAHLPTRVASYGSRVDAARLDRVLIPSRLSGRVTRYWTLNYRNSDHRAILLQVGDPPAPSAPSISALLRSAPVIERIEALLSEASQEIEGNPTGCLYVPRVEDEDYVTRASRFLRSRLDAETVEADYSSLPELWRALRVRQHRAELTTVFDAQGNLFEGKSLRRYVFNSFRERFNGSTCSPEDIAGFLEGATERITLEDIDPLHRADISLNEVEVAISRLPQGKAAGWDGIPCELVKGFEDFFGGVIHQVLADSKLRGTLPESSRRNIICLVPKAHGGPSLSGYRPISLPTADYRIVSGVLLGRLRRHLPAIVPDCQTYAVPGRCPSWNIACVSDEVALAFKNKTPLAVISTDLQSAFDNVDREFLASQLRTIGLPLPFMEWLHLLYAEADATIKVNGNFTRPFKMRRGLRQGCACSAALFSIFTGPLLRHLERILGRGNVLAYADDILLLIREDWQFERVKTIFDEFRRASGVSVNFPKSKGLWCGAWRDRADSPLGISWSASSITVLGCEITSGHGTSVQENHLLGILERAISRWSPFVRGFSLVGRARAANSLVLAAVLHHLHGYLPGDATIAKLQARLTRFVWGSCHRAAWLPGGLLARPVSVGGVGLLDIRTQLQLACFKGVQAASRNGGKNAYSWLASSILGLNHRVVPAPTLLNLPLVGACRFLATPSLRAPSRWRGVRVRDLAGPAPPLVARPTRSACDDAAALGAFCQRLVADNATSVYRERTLEEAVVLRGTATPVLRISTRTARRMLERPRLAALPISRFFRRWAPVVGVPSASTPCSSLRRCSFCVCIACGSSDLSLAHRYWSCSAVRPLIREAFSIIGRPPDLQSWIFAVGLEDHAITISSAAKHAIYVFFVDREMRGVAGDPLAIFHHTLQRWQRRHIRILKNVMGDSPPPELPMALSESQVPSSTADAISNSPATEGTNKPQPGTGIPSTSWADLVDRNNQIPMEEDNDSFTKVEPRRKRPVDSETAGRKAKRGCVQAAAEKQALTERPMPKPKVQECTTTRKKQAAFRARPSTFWRLEAKLGKGSVYQLTKMEGHILVGISSVQLADKLIEEGLDIEDATLRAFPLRKRAERIVLGNIFLFVEDADLVAALRPYGQVTSIVQKMMEMGDSSWADSRWEAFITLKDGVKLSQIPARLDVKSKGKATHVYVTYGIKCSLCNRQGHKRANCPRKTGLQERHLLLPVDAPLVSTAIPSKPPSNSNAPLPPVAAPPPAAAVVADSPPSDTVRTEEAVDLTSPTSENQSENKEPESSQEGRNIAEIQMDVLLKNKKASEAIARAQKLGLEREELLQALTHNGKMDMFLDQSNIDQRKAIANLASALMALTEATSIATLNTRGIAALRRRIQLCCFLKKHEIDICFLQETNVMSLDDVGNLCHGYSAVVVPSTTTVGSGLACVFAAGVVVHRQQILWLGKMAVIDLTVRGVYMTCVNAHVSHDPEERCRQLQIIAALAREEGAWILGDLNISEESAKDMASGSAKALAELLDQANLVDIATFFDAVLEHTRVATIRSRVDARRLDRILLPSGFCDRVTQYQTIDYAYSDHRAVLIQVGDPASTRPPCIGKLLRSDLFADRMETFIDEIWVDLANLSPPMLWEKWTRIKANLVAEIRSLAPAVAESGGGYIERASLFLRRRLEDDTARSDYHSLSDLGRSLRARRCSPSTFTDDDGNAISGGQLRRFLLERLSSRFAQAPRSEEAIADFLAEVTPLEFDEWVQLFFADISRDQIAAAIHRLSNGRASGGTDYPAIFEASRLRGALPPFSRRSKVILLPKVHGGPGLQAFRPNSLPTTDYRVLSGVLMARLRRHLPDLVPQCQTYAVPGRSSSWNIARVSDETAGASRHDTPLAVISLDLKPAFDTLSRSYLFALLENLGLPSTFLGWIAVLYGEADASIRVGDVYIIAFPLLNGVRQGCRLSAALFSIGVEPLLRRLERTLGRGNYELVSQIFEEFRMSSGVAVNFMESWGLWCGSWKHRTDSPLGISWTSESLTVLGCTITTRNTVASQASHLMGLLERAIARWSPFTRGLSLVGRARSANSLVLGSILHQLHGYLPPEAPIGRLQARLARSVWDTSRIAWHPGRILARPVSDGSVGLLDIAGQLSARLPEGIRSRAWLTPPAPDVWHSPRSRRLLSLWEAASSVFELDHRVIHPASLRSLRLRSDNRFLRPPDLLAPKRWLQATVGVLSDGAPALARSTRAALLDAQNLGAFCQRLLRENARSSYHAEYEAETIVQRGSATSITRLTSQRARRTLNSARLQEYPVAELAERWISTVDVPRSIPWADLRRNCFSGHDADVALRLALHALPHPASRRANCAACGSSDGSLTHRYWS
ncbi:hypothetical protein LAZ67_16002386 [Cordylochernes scorpioides]|uniref:Reverse transcriptase domain-containing protein n=1 Tax=Cordylochernes scorpioides TaxID=51811 RepID=A0ABY6LBY7_9ARAC|nr:hypothetical protein LAZ67_16002386 [Cordylochernes scorpioides]